MPARGSKAKLVAQWKAHLYVACGLIFTCVAATCFAQGRGAESSPSKVDAGVVGLEGFIPLGPPTLEELEKLDASKTQDRGPVRVQESKRPDTDSSASDLLVQMLQSPDAAIRARAAEGLRGAAAKDAAPLLLIALADSDGRVRDAAGRSVESLPKDELIRCVLGALGWGDPVVARGVDAALPRLRDAIEVPLIERFESRETPRVERMAAAYCLGRIGSRRAGVPLASEIWGDDLALALYCADALSSVENPNLLAEFVRMAAHPQVQVRVAAYRGLARIGGDDARKTLMEAASGRAERDTGARKIAIRLLAYVPNEEVVEYLVDQVRANAGLVAPATDALAAMFGLPYGLARERWLEWYREVWQPTKPAGTPPPSARASTNPASPVPVGFPENGFPFLP